MNQLHSEKLILLAVSSENVYQHLYNILKTQHYQTKRSTNIQSTIQKIIEFSPDLIICGSDFHDLDAYQTYNLLRRTTLNAATPYIVYIENFDSDEIIMGLELGIDNFIFAPLNEKRVISKLKLLFEKIDKHKAMDRKSFEKLFVASPIGMLVCKADKIERVNPAFYNLIGFNKMDNLPGLKDIFDFSDAPEQEKQFCKCLKGLAHDCTVTNVYLTGKEKYIVNLYISNIASLSVNRMLVQIEILSSVSVDVSVNDREAKASERTHVGESDFVLTSREYDILKISGKGTPIKLIASQLGISQRTVEKHRSNIMRKTDSTNIIEAIGKVYGMNRKLID